MTNYLKISVIGLLLLLAVLAAWQPMAAEPAAVYELTGSVGAGGTAVSGSYQTDVVIGQTAVAHHSAGVYDLGSGFWGGGLVTKGTALLRVFLPLIER